MAKATTFFMVRLLALCVFFSVLYMLSHIWHFQYLASGSQKKHHHFNFMHPRQLALTHPNVTYSNVTHPNVTHVTANTAIIITHNESKALKKQNMHYFGLHSSGWESIPDPVFVVFGNEAFYPMLANFACNMALFPGMHDHILMLVTHNSTAQKLVSLAPTLTVALVLDQDGNSYDVSKQSSFNFDTPPYIELMLERGKILLRLLNQRKTVVWLEADAHYQQNLLSRPEITGPSADIVLLWDHVVYCGCFIRFAPTAAAKTFYEEVVTRMIAQPGRHDQLVINDIMAAPRSFTSLVFDACLFRTGAAYLSDQQANYQSKCGSAPPVVQQHNWMIGAQTKIDFAKSKRAWYLGDGDSMKCAQRDLRLVVLTMDRPRSLQRLLTSLVNAQQPPTVDLYISVDTRQQGHDAATLAVLDTFVWPHGLFEIHKHETPAGIFGQWVDSWPCERFPADLYKAVVLLEDDLQVSPFYAQWFLTSHQHFASDQRVGAITGMRPALVAAGGGVPMAALVPPDTSMFAYRLIATWSMSPKYHVWREFREWVKRARRDHEDPTVGDIVPSRWYRDFLAKGTQESMWEIWFLRFMHDHDYYTLYPWLHGGTQTYVANWQEKGLHYHEDNPRPDFPLLLSQLAVAMPQQLLFVEWDALPSSHRPHLHKR